MMAITETKEKEREIHIKTHDEIAIMREAGRIAAQAHIAMRDAVRPGISTMDLNRIAETVVRDHGAIPTFIGVEKKDSPPFPAAITASVNHELVHGIPSAERILQEGDIISVDCAVTYQGYVGDCAYTWPVGDVSKVVRRLLEVTEGALNAAIKACVLPHETKDVAAATARHAERHGYSVAREYTGHGVGKVMWEAPEVPNWWPSNARKRNINSYKLQPGMTFAIEPMVIAGRADLVELDDKWTVVAKDGSLCAHFEHTVAITEGEPIILTLP